MTRSGGQSVSAIFGPDGQHILFFSQKGDLVSAIWIMNNELGEFFPAIALGGPTVNAFTAQVYEELPVVFAREERTFIQVADKSKQAAVWGMDQGATREAADVFVNEGMLERFLDLVWRRA